MSIQDDVGTPVVSNTGVIPAAIVVLAAIALGAVILLFYGLFVAT